jgi:hypothetical protein
MDALAFRRELRFALRCDDTQRHVLLTALHGIALSTYHSALHRIDAGQAASVGPDGQAIHRFVAMLDAQDRHALHAAHRLLCAETSPDDRGLPMEGQSGDLGSQDHVMDRPQVKLHATQTMLPWEETKARALASSQALHDLLTDPTRLDPARLSVAPFEVLEIDDGSKRSLPAGWCLWARAIMRVGLDPIDTLAWAGEEAMMD